MGLITNGNLVDGAGTYPSVGVTVALTVVAAVLWILVPFLVTYWRVRTSD
ncbi:MAG: hypothetical protein ACRECT_01460 [Thermoplasmata archaeon]